MKAIKVKLKDAEKVKKILRDNDLSDLRCQVKKIKNFIYFPVKKAVIGYKLIDIQLELVRELKEPEGVPASYDVIGDIIILREDVKNVKKVAEYLLKKHRYVKVITQKVGIHSGVYRVQKLKVIAGENRKETNYKENGIKIKLDVETSYFSPRLSNERKRIADLVKLGEKVLVMFSGVAPYPLVIRKHSKAKEIIGIEINPEAHKYGQENLTLNKMDRITLYQGDVRKVVPTLDLKFDRIIMPLPRNAEEFLDVALKVLKKKGVIHMYTFEEEGKEDRIIKRIQKYTKIKRYKIITVGQFAPRKLRFCVDFVPEF